MGMDEKSESLAGALDVKGVAEIERLALQAWPGLEVEANDGWLMRYASGVTRRANSVWPNDAYGESTLEAKLARVEHFYHARGLPARYQISPAMQPATLDELLALRGYRAVARTAVKTVPLAEMLARLEDAPPWEVEMMAQPSPMWWACYAEGDNVSPESLARRKAICANIRGAAAYAMVMREGEAIAVASATAAVGWVGFFNVATLAEHRRIGAARALMAALGVWGQTQGAVKAYLQVMADNETALRFYAHLGFTTGYYYHYREEAYS
jgi:GNAT superfamily N-acetyltransferase